MEYCRLQIGCLLIVVYIAFIYFRECRRLFQMRCKEMNRKRSILYGRIN